MTALISFVFAVTVSTAVIAAAERGSPADQEACTPDVFKLCSDLIPDETQIVACLESKRDQLTPACARVFAPLPAKARRTKRHSTLIRDAVASFLPEG